jgi:multidrug efflux pump subunit AcrB
MRRLGWILALAIFVIYVVLGILCNFIHPLTILSGLPSAGFGALLTLLLFHQGSEHLRVRRRDHARRSRQERTAS